MSGVVYRMMKRRIFLQNTLPLLLIASFVSLFFFSCKEDTRNYEAEIVSIHFAKRISKDTVLLVSDTITPLSTHIAVDVNYSADLQKLVPIFTLSSGATASCESGGCYDFTKPFTIIVTSENERNQREYIFNLSKLDPPPAEPPQEEEQNAEAWLTAFLLEDISGAEYEPRGTRINVLVPEGTDITNLKPKFTISTNATCDWQLGDFYDFTEPLYIRVTSEDQHTTNTFRITVRVKTPPPHQDAQILSFRFAGSQTLAEIDGSQIYAEAARGADITSLVPIIKLSEGARLSIEKGEPIDFTNPVKIEVTSQDNAAKSTYTVFASVRMLQGATLKSFKLYPLGEPTYTEGHTFGYCVTDANVLKALYPVFELSEGAKCNLTLGSPLDLSDFQPKELVVTSEDGLHSNTYQITVKKSDVPPERGTLTSFLLDAPGAESQIIGRAIECKVPEGTDLTHLKATFTFLSKPIWEQAEGPASLWLGEGAHDPEFKSGVTELDFSSPVTLFAYRKFWGIHYPKGPYTVTVHVVKEITQTKLLKELDFIGLATRIMRKQNTFHVFVGDGIDITKLKPQLTLAPGATSTLASGVAHDFTNPVDFTVTGSGISESYQIIVTRRSNDQAVLSELRIEELRDKTPVITGATYTYFAGSEIDIKALTLHFKVSEGATTNIVSGQKHDFSKPQRIVVTSQDKSITRTYTVVVDQRLNYEAELLSFGFKELQTPCKINGLKVTFPAKGLNLSALTPYYTISAGAKCNLPQNIPADFSKPVRILVTSEDGFTTKTYTVTPQLAGLTFDFERWQKVSDYDQPLGGWNSSNPGLKISKDFLGKPDNYSVQKSTDAHSGSYAARISTEGIFKAGKSIASGALFLGSFDASNIVSDPLSGPRFGVPWANVTPSVFSGWYKYIPGKQMVNASGNAIDGTDELDLYAIVFYGDQLNSHNIQNSDRVLYKARLTDLTPKKEYTRFELPFEKTGVTPPEGAVLRYTIVASSSRRGDDFVGAVGSILLLDDLEITYK